MLYVQISPQGAHRTPQCLPISTSSYLSAYLDRAQSNSGWCEDIHVSLTWGQNCWPLNCWPWKPTVSVSGWTGWRLHCQCPGAISECCAVLGMQKFWQIEYKESPRGTKVHPRTDEETRRSALTASEAFKSANPIRIHPGATWSRPFALKLLLHIGVQLYIVQMCAVQYRYRVAT